MELRAPTTFRRFRTEQRVDLGIEQLLDRLAGFRFVPLDQFAPRSGRGAGGCADEAERWGWITLEHLMDVEFTPEKVFRDPFAAFALRCDRRRVPANLYRAEVAMRERAERDATGKPVGVTRRREIREEVREELARKLPPSASSYPVLWHLRRGLVFFGGTSARASEAFVGQFQATFGVDLVALDPVELARELSGGEAGWLERLSEATPTAFAIGAAPASRASGVPEVVPARRARIERPAQPAVATS